MSPPDFTASNAPLLVGFKHPELLRRVDCRLLYPPFLARVLVLLERCAARGAWFFAELGYRSPAFQRQLFDAWRNGKGGRAAPPFQSQHQFGIALDFTHDSDPATAGLQPDWVPSNYTPLVEECAAVGLHNGKAYGDLPHVGWPGLISGDDLAPLAAIWRSGPPEADDGARLLRVWAHLGTLPLPPLSAG